MKNDSSGNIGDKIRSCVMLAADSIQQLRRSDVFRVIEAAKDMAIMQEMTEYIRKERADSPAIIAELNEVIEELK